MFDNSMGLQVRPRCGCGDDGRKAMSVTQPVHVLGCLARRANTIDTGFG